MRDDKIWKIKRIKKTRMLNKYKNIIQNIDKKITEEKEMSLKENYTLIVHSLLIQLDIKYHAS